MRMEWQTKCDGSISLHVSLMLIANGFWGGDRFPSSYFIQFDRPSGSSCEELQYVCAEEYVCNFKCRPFDYSLFGLSTLLHLVNTMCVIVFLLHFAAFSIHSFFFLKRRIYSQSSLSCHYELWKTVKVEEQWTRMRKVKTTKTICRMRTVLPPEWISNRHIVEKDRKEARKKTYRKDSSFIY